MLKKTLITSALLLSTFGAQAQVIGNSALMTQAFEQQLESYIGAGYLDFTNIFTKDSSNAAYNDSYDWHRDVDNKGPTISLMEIISNVDQSIVILAGYNPVSWDPSSSGYVHSSSTTAFLANLTHSNLFQKNTQNNYITYNGVSYGPTFGAGHDFHVSNNMTTGYANIGNSYGDRAMLGNTDYRQSLTGTGGYNAWTVGKLETFTLTAGFYEPISGGNNVVVDPVGPVAPPTAVSAPVMGGGLMLAMGLLGMRSRKQTLHSAQ
jgi:hypothetical protein